MVKGKEHFETERAILIDNFQTDRRHLHDKLRAMPGNFLATVSEQPAPARARALWNDPDAPAGPP